eukprot:CAMPEP_0198330980 /NCGR_PEP_ID=MMETSP1450-20131203/17270_1 /TAXON_ID=753684 ORGANISM="Madagascaria erythrocladiodes, Strain CCMP3234" /NCGR_SAMPLE_ID=MMETSP1450 /ASSEMBLY_ACC=CAM_ASM_001115 /LENGTH=217 /DNA_ID=CAMNT_0044035319 /DNA_START=190 /DNA_END=843 /DNA_ORIENTATION=-
MPTAVASPAATETTAGTTVWKELLESNRDFAAGVGKELVSKLTPTAREELANFGQHPEAIVVTCSDSRCPPEVVFQRTIGRLFVVRCAGNVVADFGTVGSVEYAVAVLKAPLVIVLGHSLCGAVTAGINSLDGALPGDESMGLKKLVEFIATTCKEVKDEKQGLAKEDLVKETIASNVKKSASILRESQTIAKHLADGSCTLVEAVYDLHSGLITEV